MGMNDDGTTNCDRCFNPIEGYGVIFGLLLTYYEDGELVNRIMCYPSGCRDTVLAERLNYTGSGLCTNCGNRCTRTPLQAILGSDYDQETGSTRRLTFCRKNGCADLILAAAVLPE